MLIDQPHPQWSEHRKILTPAESGIPCLPCFGLCTHHRAHPPLVNHTHPGCMEIVLILRGFQVYEVGGETFSLSGSDVFITQPDEIHSSGAPSSPFRGSSPGTTPSAAS